MYRQGLPSPTSPTTEAADGSYSPPKQRAEPGVSPTTAVMIWNTPVTQLPCRDASRSESSPEENLAIGLSSSPFMPPLPATTNWSAMSSDGL